MVNLKAFTVPLFFIVGPLLILVPRVSLAATVYAGANQTYHYIQSAAGAAQPGGTILVDGGEYHQLVIVSKPLTLAANDPGNKSLITQQEPSHDDGIMAASDNGSSKADFNDVVALYQMVMG